jgi:hypothetical protein
LQELSQAPSFALLETQQIGDDLRLRLRPHAPGA